VRPVAWYAAYCYTWHGPVRPVAWSAAYCDSVVYCSRSVVCKPKLTILHITILVLLLSRDSRVLARGALMKVTEDVTCMHPDSYLPRDAGHTQCGSRVHFVH